MPRKGSFNFVDLFSGIGGFHAALSGLGGTCVLASDTDAYACDIYEKNWGVAPEGDIRSFSRSDRVILPPLSEKVSVLAAGFPCQPFSKSGKQQGMNEERGTLFDHIMYIVAKRKPSVVLLENVRNLAGPRHHHEFMYVIECLRNEGYVVSSEPTIFSPHRIAPEFGGRPQIRERLFIAATYSPRNSHREPEKLALLPGRQMADVQAWDLSEFLDEDQTDAIGLSKDEISWLEAWDSFQREMRKKTSSRLPGFPLWADEWRPMSNQSRQRQLRQVPDWKKVFLKNNWSFFDAHESFIKRWKEKECIDDFPPSRRKFEWQAQDESSVWDCTIHLRPSGIRVKKLNYLPAFVAMNQTSILGPYLRRISPREAARLQGLPESFTFGDQPLSQTYKQLGNGVNVGVVWQVMQSLISRDQSLLEKRDPQLVQLVLSSSASPDRVIKK